MPPLSTPSARRRLSCRKPWCVDGDELDGGFRLPEEQSFRIGVDGRAIQDVETFSTERAGDRQGENVSVGLACHSSPHFGGAVVYRGDNS